MKPNHESERDPLDQALNQWRVDVPLPPRFQEQVWQRISRTDARGQSTPSFGTLLWKLIETTLVRPKFAYSYAATLLLLGVASGAWAAQHETNRLNAALGSRYVQSIDPYQKTVLNP